MELKHKTMEYWDSLHSGPIIIYNIWKLYKVLYYT